MGLLTHIAAPESPTLLHDSRQSMSLLRVPLLQGCVAYRVAHSLLPTRCMYLTFVVPQALVQLQDPQVCPVVLRCLQVYQNPVNTVAAINLATLVVPMPNNEVAVVTNPNDQAECFFDTSKATDLYC